MNRDQINHKNMIGQVTIFFTNHPTLAEENDLIPPILARVNSGIQEVEALELIQIKNTQPYTQTKGDLFELVAGDLLKVGMAVKALAPSLNDKVLYDAMSFGKSALNNMREEDFVAKGKQVCDKAKPHIGSVARYRVTSDDLDKLVSNLAAYIKAKPGPRTVKTETSQATADIDAKLFEIMEILRNELDDQMDPVQHYDATLYGIYRNARAVVDQAATHSKTEDKEEGKEKPA